MKKITKAEYIVHKINSIKSKYPKLRQKSKTVTFALQYQGTEYTLMNNSGFSEEEASSIVKNYNNTYKVSKDYTNVHLKDAFNNGYIEVAFGLRLRTPAMYKAKDFNRLNPLAAKEARTAGNAISQSYGMLNMRCLVEFMDKVWKSPYKYSIKPVCSIHDANYFVCGNTYKELKFINDNLIASMQWQELEPIKHNKVHLKGELDLFYKGWHQPITLTNNSSIDELHNTIEKGKLKYVHKQA